MDADDTILSAEGSGEPVGEQTPPPTVESEFAALRELIELCVLPPKAMDLIIASVGAAERGVTAAEASLRSRLAVAHERIRELELIVSGKTFFCERCAGLGSGERAR